MRGLGETAQVTLDPACYAIVDKASAAVDAIIAGDAQVHGVNTGVGSLANQAISAEMASEM
jgi:histidine ammonia-lyase